MVGGFEFVYRPFYQKFESLTVLFVYFIVTLIYPESDNCPFPLDRPGINPSTIDALHLGLVSVFINFITCFSFVC